MKFDYCEYIDGPQGRLDATGRVIPGKGGGGGGSTPYYANMDQLYGVQSQAAQYMLDQSMPYIPGYIQNSQTMVNEAMDGTLANKMRDQAGNDAQAAVGSALGSVNRNMQRYGAQFSTARMLSEGNRSAILGAAQKSGALNQATAAAEDLKWNRNAGAFGQVTGMGSGAMQSLGSSAAGYGAAGNGVMANEARNAAGYGQFGAAMANSMFADGGYVGDAHLAQGGDAWAAWKNQNPVRSGGLQQGSSTSPIAAAATAMAPYALGSGLKYAWGNGLGDAAAKAYGAAKGAVADSLGLVGTQAPAAVVDKVGSGLAAAAGEALPTGVAEAAGTTAASEAAGAAAADAALSGTASGALSGVATALPWVGGAMLLANATGLLDDFFASGGSVGGRKDFRPGGPVHGPGTETSDSIPARLSKGEYVLNAEAVKLIGKKKLDALNKRGLKLRGKKEEAAEGTPRVVDSAEEERVEARGLKLAKGGVARKGC